MLGKYSGELTECLLAMASAYNKTNNHLFAFSSHYFPRLQRRITVIQPPQNIVCDSSIWIALWSRYEILTFFMLLCCRTLFNKWHLSIYVTVPSTKPKQPYKRSCHTLMVALRIKGASWRLTNWSYNWCFTKTKIYYMYFYYTQ